MNIQKDFIFASTDYLIFLNRLKLKSSKEFQEISATMETYFDQIEAIVNNAEKKQMEMRLKNAMLTLERDAISKEIGQLLNEAYKRDKELFNDLLQKFTVLPKPNNGHKGKITNSESYF